MVVVVVLAATVVLVEAVVAAEAGDKNVPTALVRKDRYELSLVKTITLSRGADLATLAARVPELVMPEVVLVEGEWVMPDMVLVGGVLVVEVVLLLGTTNTAAWNQEPPNLHMTGPPESPCPSVKDPVQMLLLLDDKFPQFTTEVWNSCRTCSSPPCPELQPAAQHVEPTAKVCSLSKQMGWM